MPVRYNCPSCPTVLSVATELAVGQRIRCPKCSTVFAPVSAPPATEPPASADTLATPSEAVMAAPSANAPSASPFDEFTPLSSPAMGRVTGRYPRKWLWYVVPPVVLLALGAAWLAWGLLFSGGSATEDLRFMPPGCVGVVFVKMQDVLASKPYQDVRKEFPMVEKDLENIQRTVGMPASKVRSLTSFIAFGEGPVELIVVHANTAVSAADLKSGIQSSKRKHEKNVRFEELREGSHTIVVESYQYDFGEPPDMGSEKRLTGRAFVLIDDRTVLFSNGDAPLRKALKQDAVKPPERLQKAINSLSGSSTGFVAFDFQPKGAKGGNDLRRLVNVFPGADQVQQGIESVSIDFHLGAEITAAAHVHCRDAKTAEDLRKMADGGLVTVRNLAKAKGDVPKELTDMLDLVKLSTHGSQLSARANVGPDAVAATIKAFLRK